MSERELLPCPFCGGRPMKAIGQLGDGSPWHYVECLECAASAQSDGEWNVRADKATRADERARTLEEVVRLRELLQDLLDDYKFGRRVSDQQLAAYSPEHPAMKARNYLARTSSEDAKPDA